MTHTTSSPRRWLLRILILLPGIAAAVILLLGAALLVLDDADYKRILTWAAATFLDTELEIAGPFSIKFSDGIHVTAGDVRLRAHDGGYVISTQHFNTDFRVISILSGALVINNLILTDTRLRINESEIGDDDKAAGFSIPPVVVARAHFRNVELEYQEARPGTLHTFSLNELLIGDGKDAESLGIQANGLFQGREYDVSGALPSLADMLERDAPCPVKVIFRSEYITASLDGHVADFVKGRGLDLKLELHARDVQEILEIFADGIPRIGDLDATARLVGDYDSPGLDEIDINLHRDDEVELKVRGKVANVITGKGLDLGISGHSSRPAVASWLLFGKLDRVSTLRLDAKLQAQYGRILLHDIQASASSSDGLELEASGNAELYEAGHEFAKNDSGITVRFSAPTTAALNLPDFKGIPELGAVNGNLRLLASRDAIGIYDADVHIGKGRGQQSLLKGSITRIGLLEEAAVTGIDLNATLRIPRASDLAKLAGYDLPALGRGQVDLRANGALDKLRLSNVNISVGDAGSLLLTAKGTADRLDLTRQPLPDSADFSVTATAPRLAEISRFLDLDLPDLGRTHANGQMKLRGNKLLFEQVRVDIGAADQPAIRMNGKATTILRKGSSIDASFDVATTDLLMAFTDLKPGYLGRLEGVFRISSMAGSWSIQQFKLTSAQTRLYQLEIGGEREDFNKTDLVNVKTSMTVRDPAALGYALNLDLSGISPWTMKGLLSTKADTLSYHGTGTLGSTTSTTIVNGYIKDGKPHFTGKMATPVLYLKDFGFGKEVAQPAVNTISDKADRTYIFSREPLNISILKRFNLDFDLLIDQVESRGELSIDSVNGKLKVLDGKLYISPLKLLYEGGQIDINFDINAVDVPTYKLHVTGDDILLGPLMAQVQDDVPITGYSNIDLDLSTQGKSPHDLASSLNGNISLGLENAKVPTKYVKLLSVDVLGWAFSKTIEREPYTNLNCVVMAFDVKDGVVASRLLIADGPKLTVGGNIGLDLGAETMNIVLIPKQKKRIFSSAEPVRIRGPIMDPKVEAIPVKTAIAEVGAMALLPAVVIPVRLIGNLWSLLNDNDKPGEGCASLEAVTEAAEKQSEK